MTLVRISLFVAEFQGVSDGQPIFGITNGCGLNCQFRSLFEKLLASSRGYQGRLARVAPKLGKRFVISQLLEA